jgi:8-oxo-dGTP pyrophosphatase MutT (NUDIX family)
VSRVNLIQALKEYQSSYPAEKKTCDDFISFVDKNPLCFDRALQKGHVTGSAWIINHDTTHCLLVFHKKLQRWLQPGGHADGNPDVYQVALREAMEETGLKHFSAISENIFDLDIHTIPSRPGEPEHAHYDIRYLFVADKQEPLIISGESLHLEWIALEELDQITKSNQSILRMADKAKVLARNHQHQPKGDHN